MILSSSHLEHNLMNENISHSRFSLLQSTHSFNLPINVSPPLIRSPYMGFQASKVCWYSGQLPVYPRLNPAINFSRDQSFFLTLEISDLNDFPLSCTCGRPRRFWMMVYAGVALGVSPNPHSKESSKAGCSLFNSSTISQVDRKFFLHRKGVRRNQCYFVLRNVNTTSPATKNCLSSGEKLRI